MSTEHELDLGEAKERR